MPRPSAFEHRAVLAVVLGAALLLVACIGLWMWRASQATPWQRDPTPVPAPEVEAFAAWVSHTESAAVARAWAEATADGIVTEAERIDVEAIAASEPVPFGLASPVRD